MKIFNNCKIFILQNLFLIFFISFQVKGQTNTISPKLDFDDTNENNNNSSVPILPGFNKGRSDGHNSNNNGSWNNSNANSGGSGKSGPKIHGVRVTVDTGDSKKSKESKESVEITDLGKNKKRVGIHTDITFEITADAEDVNGTSTERRHNRGGDSDEDASVPIFKGRGGSRNKSRKPYDSKNRWNTNFSNERRGHETGRNYPNYGGYYPHYQPNAPSHTGTHHDGHSETASGTGTIYRTRDGWTSFVPSTWTTERSFSEYYRPNTVTAQRMPSWKPCYCLSSESDYRRRRDSQTLTHTHTHTDDEVVKPTSSVIQVLDSKVERPFSK